MQITGIHHSSLRVAACIMTASSFTAVGDVMMFGMAGVRVMNFLYHLHACFRQPLACERKTDTISWSLYTLETYNCCPKITLGLQPARTLQATRTPRAIGLDLKGDTTSNINGVIDDVLK